MNEIFSWKNGNTPILKRHSEAKLRLLDSYISKYFDALAVFPEIDRIQVSFIDGFCGGGVHLFDGIRVDGSPLVMLRAVKIAEYNLNQGRSKPLIIDAKFYFVEKNKDAFQRIKFEIENSEFKHLMNDSICIFNDTFENKYKDILNMIKIDSPKSGKSIFLLDQFGYKDVPFEIIRNIYNNIPKSEIILTFSVDEIVNFISNNAIFAKAVMPVEFSTNDINNILSLKENGSKREILHNYILKHIIDKTIPRFFTPFFIYSEESKKHLWILHFSKEQKARDVMTQAHWEIQNNSISPSKAGFQMLGYDPRKIDNQLSLFNFDEKADKDTKLALFEQIPKKISELDSFSPVSIETFHSTIANLTQARNDQIDESLINLYNEGEIDILTESGREKQKGAKLKNSDRLQISRQLYLFGKK